MCGTQLSQQRSIFLPCQVDFFSDELNHASIIDGLRIAGRGKTHVYKHNDLEHLDNLLKVSPLTGPIICLLFTLRCAWYAAHAGGTCVAARARVGNIQGDALHRSNLYLSNVSAGKEMQWATANRRHRQLI